MDLVQHIREGIPKRAYVPGGEGWLIVGKRYLVYSPAGVGKSLGLRGRRSRSLAGAGRWRSSTWRTGQTSTPGA